MQFGKLSSDSCGKSQCNLENYLVIHMGKVNPIRKKPSSYSYGKSPCNSENRPVIHMGKVNPIWKTIHVHNRLPQEKFTLCIYEF